MKRDQLIANIQNYGLKAGEAMDVVRMVDKYIEENTKQYSAKGALSLAELVEKMRESQKEGYVSRNGLEMKVDKAINRIKAYDSMNGAT